MKKQIIYLLCFPLLSIYSYSQEKESYLDLSFGPSFPIGKYASKNLSDSKSGFAKTGQQVNVSYTYMLNKRFGLSASLYAQRNPVDYDALRNESSTNNNPVPVFTDSLVSPTAPPIGITGFSKGWTFKKHAWLAASVLIGGIAELPLNTEENFSFIGKVMIGAIGIKSPELDGQYITDSSIARATQTSKSTFGFIYLVRAGMKYDITKKISLIVALDYVGTNEVTFKNIKATIAAAGQTSTGIPYASQAMRTGNVKQAMQAINLNAGIALKL